MTGSKSTEPTLQTNSIRKLFGAGMLFVVVLVVYHFTENNYSSIIKPTGRLYSNTPNANYATLETRNKTTGLQYSKELIQDQSRQIQQFNETMVLLLTYFRSGSTFTADIIQQSSEVFYIYEPLRPFMRNIYFSGTKFCNTSNNNCMYPYVWENDPVVAMTELRKIYNCKLKDLRDDLKQHIQQSKRISMDHTFFNTCTKIRSDRYCVGKLQNICGRRRVRLIKTIRVKFTLADKLMKIYPNLKVIHLVRDPRGIMVSRRYKYDDNYSKLVKATCMRMLNDVVLSRQLKRKYPGRIKTVLYENIATSPIEHLQDLYDFIGLSVSKRIKAYVLEHTSAGNKNNGYYATMRGNSTETAYNWRSKISTKEKQMIETSCAEFYQHTKFYPVP